MKVTVLGCGGSGGVPLIGHGWGDCDPKNPKNERLRASILVQTDQTTLLIDASPDLRTQLLAANADKIDAVLVTHTHADHIHGIDDLRPVNRAMGADIPIYASPNDLATIETRFAYVFEPLNPQANGFYYKPVLTPNEISGPFSIGDIEIIPFEQDHGFSKSLGFRFGDFAYSTDVVDLSEDAFEVLAGVKVWMVDVLRIAPHDTHAHLDKTLNWIERVGPDKAILTHMSHQSDYDVIAGLCPDHVTPAYDTMVIEVG